MQFGLRGNRCQGWLQAVAYHDDGTEHSASARVTTQGEAVEAIRVFNKHGKWPKDLVEQPVELCPSCGQVVQPDD